MGSIWSRARRLLDLIALNLALLLMASAIASRARGLHHNTLSIHEDWRSTKPHLARYVMASREFEVGRRGLAGDRLDLGAWFGFQEVLYRRPLRLTELDASVRFERDGYVYVLFDVREDGFSGVRLSDRADLPSIHFRASPQGEFTVTRALALPDPVAPDAWHQVEIRFEHGRATILLDGRSDGAFERTDGPQRIGFRGGQRAALVDDVTLRLADGATIRENFSNSRHGALRTLVLFCLGSPAMLAAGLLVRRWRAVPDRSIALAAVPANLVLVAVAAGVYAFEFFSAANYPAITSLVRQAETNSMTARQQQLVGDVRRDYAPAAAGNPYRILVLGSSQTWGAGASAPSDIWVQQLERMLNQDRTGRRFECINAGLSGLTSRSILLMLPDLLTIHPQAALINLSNNDIDTAQFHANLDSIVTTLTEAGVRTVLLLEPNSPERRITDSEHGDLAAKHRIVAALGAARGVPVIDLQRYLAQRNNTGLLWWDFVHLTSLGHRLVAERLRVDLPVLLFPAAARR